MTLFQCWNASDWSSTASRIDLAPKPASRCRAQVLHRISDRLTLHLRTRPICIAFEPERGRRTWQSQCATSLLGTYGGHHRRIRELSSLEAVSLSLRGIQFNPAKTLGNMTLALRFCFFLALGSIGVSLLSIATIELFDYFSPSRGSNWDFISEMGDWVVCVLYIGGSMGTLAWLKIWVGNPSFGSGKLKIAKFEWLS